MVDYSDIRHISPSVVFFFAHLGASLGFSSDHYLWVGDFALGESSLGLVLGDLYPLLCRSLDWFGTVQEVLRKERMGSEVRSSDLETRLSSSAGTAGAETDTATFLPVSSQPFVSQPP